MYELAKRILFNLPAESAHHFTSRLFNTTQSIPGLKSLIRHSFQFDDKSLEKEVFGLRFPNPVGLAAGFDKDGKYLESMADLGFGFIEVGTVTPKPQKGNPRPRLFRLKEDEAIINRMGFNNDGVDALVRRLERIKKRNYILGGNIGKNKWTPNEEALNDYLICFDKLFDLVDYFVVNVSSPNTPDLRQLQEKEPLKKLLEALQEANAKKADQKPILLKIAPDLTEGQLIDIVEIVSVCRLSGIIATNTTISRDGLNTSENKIFKIGAGGLSGAPLTSQSTKIVRSIFKLSEGKIPIVGVGGIMTIQDAKEKLDAGASLIQLYSGLIYSGPGIIRDIKKSLVKGKN